MLFVNLLGMSFRLPKNKEILDTKHFIFDGIHFYECLLCILFNFICETNVTDLST